MPTATTSVQCGPSDTDANSVIVYTITLTTTPPLVTLARTGSSTVRDGRRRATVEFTVTLGRALIAGEIIDAPLTVSGTNITTADWSLATKSPAAASTPASHSSMKPPPHPSCASQGQRHKPPPSLLTAAADNTAETGGPETLTLALGPNDRHQQRL